MPRRSYIQIIKTWRAPWDKEGEIYEVTILTDTNGRKYIEGVVGPVRE